MVITRQEFDNQIVWNEYINAKQAKKLKKLEPKKKYEPKEEKSEEKKAHA